MKKLNETALALFKDTPSKRFLIDVITSLANHGHVSIEEIDKKDEEQHLVWNWLNKAASSFSVEKIIQLLQRLNLFENTANLKLSILKDYKIDNCAKTSNRGSNMLIESGYTNVMLDGIASYIASVKLKKNGKMSFNKCVNTLAENTGFKAIDIAESFGEIIENALSKASEECLFDESFLNFINEDENDVSQNVTQAEKEQKGGSSNTDAIDKHTTDDKLQNNGHNNRIYFAYCNFNEGKMFICSKLNQEEGAVANVFAKLGNFLSTISAPTFKNGILIAPISLNVARSLVAHKKVKYLDLTKAPNNTQSQTNNTQSQTNNKQSQNKQQ